MSKNSVGFGDLDFGFTSAETERTRNPKLLIEGFHDPDRIIPEAKDGYRFLFLGNKGAGKSAIAEHLTLKANKLYNLFVSTTYLSDFPFDDFKNIIRGDEAPESKYPKAWAWLLLIKVFNSLNKDNAGRSTNPNDFQSAIDVLEELDLLSDESLKNVAKATSKRSFKISVTSFELSYQENAREQGVRIPFFTERLKNIAATFQSQSNHIIIIDGLDDILTYRKVQYQSLAALILEADRLNKAFQASKTPIKIIILCRTDLYERLPGTNKNKIRQDSSYQINWNRNVRNFWESDLIRLANKRAKLSASGVDNVFSRFLPVEIHGTPTQKYMLDHTRHTPRDFLQILRCVQECNSGRENVSEQNFLAGMANYSTEYFLPEIKDEMVGYYDGEETRLIFNLITYLGQTEFTLSQIAQKAQNYDHFKDLEIEEMIGVLYECSAIGNIDDRPDRRYYKYKYRNKNSNFDKMSKITVHRALWKALNLK